MALAVSTLAWSCLKNNSDSAPTGFDFAMNKIVNLTVDYSADMAASRDLDGNNVPRHYMTFDVYAENPFTSVDRNTMKEGIKPVLRVFADENGFFSGQMKLPIAAKKLWFYTKTLGVSPLVVVDVPDGKSIRLDMTADHSGVSAVRGTRASHTYPSDLHLMKSNIDWNNKGVLTNVTFGGKWNNNISSTINGVFKEGVNLNDKFSSLLKTTPVFRLPHNQGAHTVIMRFAHNDGTKTPTIGYYTYQYGSAPTSLSQVHLTLAMPNASSKTDGGAYAYSEGIQLQYWNGSGYSNQFPRDCCIGFVVIPDGFDPATGNIKDLERYYSNKEFNTNGMQQLAAFFNQGNNVFICGVEYHDRSVASTNPGDNDFSDLIFFIDPNPRQDGGAMQIVPTDPEPEDPVEDPDTVTDSYFGTLIFEDLWPWQGDYDINDVVVEYTSDLILNTENRVIKIVDKFRPVNCGATLQNGFAIQYGFAPSVPTSVTVIDNYSPVGAPKTYEHAPHREIPWTVDGKGYETGQSKACILLFDDIRRANIASGAYTWTVTTVFEGYLPTREEVTLPPYNPFIVIHHGESDDARNHELHLANYVPTDKATMKWFRTADDVSSPPVSFYITNDFHPFAIDIPMHNFVLAPEKQRIETVYSFYGLWASSRGTLHTDWYMHPNIP